MSGGDDRAISISESVRGRTFGCLPLVLSFVSTPSYSRCKSEPLLWHAPTVNVDLSEIPDALTLLEGIYQRMTRALSGFPSEHSCQHVTDVILRSKEQSNYNNAGSFFIQHEPDGGLFHAHEAKARLNIRSQRSHVGRLRQHIHRSSYSADPTGRTYECCIWLITQLDIRARKMVKDQLEVPFRFCGELKIPHYLTAICAQSSVRYGYPCLSTKPLAPTGAGRQVAATQPVPSPRHRSFAEANQVHAEGQNSGWHTSQIQRDHEQTCLAGPTKRSMISQSFQFSFCNKVALSSTAFKEGYPSKLITALISHPLLRDRGDFVGSRSPYYFLEEQQVLKKKPALRGGSHQCQHSP